MTATAARLRYAVLLLMPLGLGLFVHRGMPGCALLGFDTYPLLIASRVQGWTDFKGTFTEVMMDGRYPGGAFYRPTQNLVLAVEYALWGVRAAGYQLTSLLFFAACIALLFVVTRRLMGPAAWAGPLIGALFYALHPSLLMMLPVVARRVELLVMACTLTALLVLPLGAQRGRMGRAIVAGLFVLLASGAKEIGVLGAMLVFLHALLFGYEESVGKSLRRAALAAVPAALGVVLYMTARMNVIGALGGHEGTKIETWWDNVQRYQADFAAGVLCPWSFLPAGNAAAWTGVALVVLVLLSIAALVTAAVSRDRGTPHYARLLAFGWAWAISNVVFNGLAGTFNPRYVMLCMAGVAIVLAALVEWSVSLLRGRGRGAEGSRGPEVEGPRDVSTWPLEPSPPRPLAVSGVGFERQRLALRAVGALAGLAILCVVALALQASPLFVTYWEWPEATRRENEFLARLEGTLRNARPGTRVEQRDMPHMPEAPEADRPSIPVAAMLADYSVQAWADLTFPERKIRVVRGAAANVPPPKPDEILLVLRYQRAAVDRFPGQIRPE